MRSMSVLSVLIVLLPACAPSIHRTAPARADALHCASAHLQSRGYSVSLAEGKARAERTVEQEWVYRVDHVIQAFLEQEAARLVVRGFVLETKTPGKDQPSTSGRVLQPTHRWLAPDSMLAAVLDEVVGTCATATHRAPRADQVANRW